MKADKQAPKPKYQTAGEKVANLQLSDLEKAVEVIKSHKWGRYHLEVLRDACIEHVGLPKTGPSAE